MNPVSLDHPPRRIWRHARKASAIAVFAGLALAGLMGPFGAPLRASAGGAVFYVTDTGSDQADGRSVTTALASLDHARDLARAGHAAATIYVAGYFLRSEPFRLGAADAGDTIMAMPNQHAEIYAANGAKTGIQLGGADNVTIAGLTLSGFSADGIIVYSSINAHIVLNVVRNTFSTRWSQGAIHLSGSVPGSEVVGNVVEAANYAGIIIDTNATSNVSNVRVIDNKVFNTCRKVADCGAIYVNDRGRQSAGVVIKNNLVTGFGPQLNNSRGIYLDDWASHVMVQNNTIVGPGTSAFMIHGGHDNTIVGNKIDMAKVAHPLLYQPAVDGTWNAMTGNVIQNNSFMSGVPVGIAAQLAGRALPDAALPMIVGNRACVGNQCSATQ